MWQAIRTIFVVTIVTCLVWLYAESENVRSQAFEADIQFVAPANQPLAIRPAQPRRVRIIARGPAASFAQVERLTRNGPIPIVVRENPSAPDSGESIVLKDRLATSSPLSPISLTITEVQPAIIHVNIESLKSVAMPVKVDAGSLQGSAVAEPNAVEVSVPARLAAAMAGESLTATLDERWLSELETNVPHTVDADLTPPESLRNAGVPINLPRVKVTVKVLRQSETIVVPLIPVLLQVSSRELARFNVVVNESNAFLHDIKLTGPSDAIERIRRQEVHVKAFLAFTAEDLERDAAAPNSTATPVLSLPPGVTPTEALPVVSFKVGKRE